MSWFFTLLGKASGNTAEVNDSNELQVALSSARGDAGFAKILDSEGNDMLVTEHGYLNVSTDSMVLWEQVDGTALNTNKWATSASGMTVAQANGYITLNSGGALASAAYAILQSIKYIPLYSYLPLKISFQNLASVLPQANATMELGIGLVATNAAPTDGVFFRWSTAGEFRCVISTGGVETLSTAVTPPAVNDASMLDIVIVEDAALFLVDDVLVASIGVPIAYSYPTSAGRLPIFARVYNGGSAPAQAPKLNIGQVVVVQQGLAQNKPWAQTLASMGMGAYQAPVTPFGTISAYVNSANPNNATLSNTAAGYASKDGPWAFAALVGAATSYALFSYQVPAGYQLNVQGVSISTMVTGAAVAVTPTELQWAIGVNGSAVSLATADGAGTWSPRSVMLGMQGFKVGDLAGQVAPDIDRHFDTPLVIDGGRYVTIILQVPVGTATVSQVFRGMVTVQGYFE